MGTRGAMSRFAPTAIGTKRLNSEATRGADATHTDPLTMIPQRRLRKILYAVFLKPL